MEWNGLFLDKSSAVPLYEQLRQGLLNAISEGQIPQGSKLPTEEELCAALGISRPVARQAYSALIEAGYVERKRGKGTFVRRPGNLGRFIHRQFSFAQEMEILNLPHRTQLLRQEWTAYAPELFGALKLQQGERCLHLVRMRYVSEAPYVLVENYIPEPVFPGIDRYDFEQRSLYDVFEKEYRLRVTRSRRTICARAASAEQADLFGVRRRAPMLCIKNVVLDQYDRPIDWSEEYLDGNVRSFEFDVINP